MEFCNLRSLKIEILCSIGPDKEMLNSRNFAKLVGETRENLGIS